MILYFSGTGNSKYIANVLASKIGERTVNANELIKNGESPKMLDGERLIFVSPVYAWRFPKIFQKLIEKSGLSGKAYFVITCGNSICNAEKYLKKMCKKAGIELMGVAEIVMPENYIAMFTAPKKEEISKIIEKAKIKAESLAESIIRGEELPSIKTDFRGKFLSSALVNGGFYIFSVSAKKFYVTDKCVSCGKCKEECALNNIKIVNGKPKWGNNCTHCMACICKCPKLAIEYGNKTKNKERYVCPL